MDGSVSDYPQDITDIAHHDVNKRPSNESPEQQGTNHASHETHPEIVSPQFLKTFSNALNIASMADSVLESASKASYRSFVADNLAKQTFENSQAVADIAHDVCRTAVAAAQIALETSQSVVSIEDAYASFVHVKKPPLSYEQLHRVMQFAQSHSNEKYHKVQNSTVSEPTHFKHSQTPARHCETKSLLRQPLVTSKNRERKSRRDNRSPPTEWACRSRSRSPDTFHEKFPSTVEQCMEEFAHRCSSCSSLPSLPEDKEIDIELPSEEDEVSYNIKALHHGP